MAFFGKKKAAKNKAMGLCACGQPPRLEKKSCERCAERIRKESKARKDSLKRQGVCLHCEVNPSSRGMTLCESCLQRSNKNGQARYHFRVESHLCLACPNPATDGRYCSRCASKVRECDRKRSKSKSSLYADRHSALGLCITCSNPRMEGKRHCLKCDEKSRVRGQRRRSACKQGVLSHYGKLCVWPSCGISDPDLLTLDHINNDGAGDRKSLYQRVIKEGFPERFQVLCWNHQWKKRMMLLRKQPLPESLQIGDQR